MQPNTEGSGHGREQNKTMKTKSFLLYLATLNLMALLPACDMVTCVEPGMERNNTPKTYPQFTGEWQWYQTYNGWLGLETPAQKGYTETITFGADNIFKKRRNNVVVEETTYTIAKVKSAETGRDSVFVYYLGKSNAAQPLFLLSADTLHTRPFEVCNDCPEVYYVRKKATGTD
jgi:hypothetical protein